jgi:hypothetical protein
MLAAAPSASSQGDASSIHAADTIWGRAATGNESVASSPAAAQVEAIAYVAAAEAQRGLVALLADRQQALAAAMTATGSGPLKLTGRSASVAVAARRRQPPPPPPAALGAAQAPWIAAGAPTTPAANHWQLHDRQPTTALAHRSASAPRRSGSGFRDVAAPPSSHTSAHSMLPLFHQTGSFVSSLLLANTMAAPASGSAHATEPSFAGRARSRSLAPRPSSRPSVAVAAPYHTPALGPPTHVPSPYGSAARRMPAATAFQTPASPYLAPVALAGGAAAGAGHSVHADRVRAPPAVIHRTRY